jgi:hypothetical protein
MRFIERSAMWPRITSMSLASRWSACWMMNTTRSSVSAGSVEMKFHVAAPHGFDGKNEEHEVGVGQEAFGDFLVALLDGVGAGRVDQVEVAQEFDRPVALLEHRRDLDVAGRIAIAIPEHAVGFRQHVDAAEFASEKTVDQRGFAGIHLAADDEEKRVAETALDFGEGQAVAEIGEVSAARPAMPRITSVSRSRVAK